MDLPEKLLEDLFAESEVFFFTNGTQIGVPGHFHICVMRKEKIVCFTACTSQINTIYSFISHSSIDPNTIPCIHPSQTNGFKELTFVDCNRVFDCHIQLFVENYKKGNIQKWEGHLSIEEMKLLIKGIKLSKTVADNIKQLFE